VAPEVDGRADSSGEVVDCPNRPIITLIPPLRVVRGAIMPSYLEVCESAIREAGKVLSAHVGRVTVREKGRSDLVTEADYAAQETVRGIVLGAFPDHELLGEEDPNALSPRPAVGFRWIVDPLDGTTNFVHQVPFFCCSLALEHAGDFLVGGIYNPFSGECFLAERGQGAYLNGVRLHTSGVAEVRDALAAAGFPAVVTPDSPDKLLFDRAVIECQAVRRTGSAALNLAYVAAGRFDVAWTYCAKVWDAAAGVLLIAEAGGTITDWHGRPLPANHAPFLAAGTPALHEAFLSMCRAAETKEIGVRS
jgi:myo-inositol-1(or 4)-monophosphatase